MVKILYDDENYIIWFWWLFHCCVITWKSMHS